MTIPRHHLRWITDRTHRTWWRWRCEPPNGKDWRARFDALDEKAMGELHRTHYGLVYCDRIVEAQTPAEAWGEIEKEYGPASTDALPIEIRRG